LEDVLNFLLAQGTVEEFHLIDEAAVVLTGAINPSPDVEGAGLIIKAGAHEWW